jgi:hypothetical protein
MFLRYRFVWLVISIFLVLIVGACSTGFTEGVTAEQITAVGCDASASEGQMKRCFATVIDCDPQNLPEEQKMNECIVDKIENDYGCGTIGETNPSEIAECMVRAIQGGETPGGE